MRSNRSSAELLMHNNAHMPKYPSTYPKVATLYLQKSHIRTPQWVTAQLQYFIAHI